MVVVTAVVMIVAVIIVVGVIVIVLKFVFPVSYSVSVSSSGVAVDLFMDALADVTIAVLAGIGMDVLAVMTALEFPVSTPLERVSRCAAFDCRSRALLDCSRVLQTWMPSYHV